MKCCKGNTTFRMLDLRLSYTDAQLLLLDFCLIQMMGFTLTVVMIQYYTMLTTLATVAI